MSLIDKALSSIAPPVSDAAQAETARRARWTAAPGDWLSLALDQHAAIREAFDACRAAQGRTVRVAAMKSLARVLNAHAMAEELVLYPALARAGDKLAAGRAYADHTAVKLQMADLELTDPSGDAWLDKLEQIRASGVHHMHEEERGWFLDLKEKGQDQAYLTRRFQEEFERYSSARAVPPEPEALSEASPEPTAEPRSFAPTRPTTGELDRH